MGLRYSQEIFENYPLRPDAVTFGKVTAKDANAFFLLNGKTLLSGALAYDSVNIKIEGGQVIDLDGKFPVPDFNNFGTVTFIFQGRTWTLTDCQKSGKYSVANSVFCYYTYTITGIDITKPLLSIS